MAFMFNCLEICIAFHKVNAIWKVFKFYSIALNSGKNNRFVSTMCVCVCVFFFLFVFFLQNMKTVDLPNNQIRRQLNLNEPHGLHLYSTWFYLCVMLFVFEGAYLCCFFFNIVKSLFREFTVNPSKHVCTGLWKHLPRVKEHVLHTHRRAHSFTICLMYLSIHDFSSIWFNISCMA